MKVGACVLIFRDEKILLGRRRDRQWWELPGGKVEFGEAPQFGAHREVLEETGITLKWSVLLGEIVHADHPMEPVESWLCKVYGSVTGSEPIVMEPEKVAAWVWWDLKTLCQEVRPDVLDILTMLGIPYLMTR